MAEAEPITRRQDIPQKSDEQGEYIKTGTYNVYIYVGRVTTCIGHSRLAPDGKSFVLEPEHFFSRDKDPKEREKKGCLQRSSNSGIITQ